MNDAAVYYQSARQCVAKARVARSRGDLTNVRGFVNLARHWNRRARNSTTPLNGERPMATELLEAPAKRPTILKTKREHELVRAGLDLLAEQYTKSIKLSKKIGLDPAPAEEVLEELKGDSETGAGGLISRFTAQLNLWDQR